jgi:hypothetical protein
MNNIEERLLELGKALIDQKKARIIVEPDKREKGFWFGGGKILKDKKGRLVVSGRYRNAGDSRYGTAAGERGLELAVFVSNNKGISFKKILSWHKQDLLCAGKKVISIEGSSLYFGEGKVKMFVSTEKNISYPQGFEKYQKPGTGIWEIDVFEGETLEGLDVSKIKTVLSSVEPEKLHIKDPVVFDMHGQTYILYCKHPFSWNCSYTGLARLKNGDVAESVSEDILPRGYTWDIAVSRLTCRLPVPKIGIFADLPSVSLYFYDGAECVREHPQSEKGVQRPRGYSCEEIGGLAWGFDEKFPEMFRLSKNFPLFWSDAGTGCSRYVSALWDGENILACWQKSMADFSQPLVFNSLNKKEVEEILR